MVKKHCSDCERDLPLTAFTRNKRNKDGLAFYCAECARKRHTVSRRRRLGPPRTRHGQGPTAVPPGHKWCSECDAVKPLSDFPSAPRTRLGVGAYCKPCFNAVIRRNREKNHGSTRQYHLKHRYGITEAEFDAMLEAQVGLCAICCEAPAAHVDHDHATGRVRGLLCFNCNGALGQFRDRADLMLLAVHYLERGAQATWTRPPGVVVSFAPEYEDPRPPGEPRDVPPSMIA